MQVSSRQHRVGVIDVFNRKTVDIDGDNIADTSHGELVSRIIQAESKRPVTIDKLPVTGIEGEDTSHYAPQVADHFTHVAEHAEDYDAVNVSLSFDAHMQNDIMPNTLAQMSAVILEELKASVDPYAQNLAKATEALKQLATKNLKVFIGGGNNGPTKYNLLTANDHTTAIGALDAQGNKAPYSADNNRIAGFESGLCTIRKVRGGFDINGDDTPEFSNAEVSSQGKSDPSFKLIGQKASESLASPQDITELAEKHHAGENIFKTPASKTVSSQ